MRIIGYLLQHKAALLLVVCLLTVQAFCDLSLPRYTSDIVDVGIQQSGISDAAPSVMTRDTFEALCMMVPDDDEHVLRDSYEEDGKVLRLTSTGAQRREQLNRMVALPLIAVHRADQMEGFDLAALKNAYDLGLVTKDEIASHLEGAFAAMEAAGESLVGQQAIAAAKEEYLAAGEDVDQMQMDYLLHVGATMLGLAALAMVVSILVCLVAARTGAKIGRDLRSQLFAKVVSFSDGDVNRFSAASLITRGTNDIQLIQMVTIIFQRMVLYAPILAMGGIILVAQTNLSMAWVIVLGIGIIVCVVGLLMAITMPKFRIMQKLIDKVNLVSREILTGLPVIRAFGQEEREQQRFDDASMELKKTQLFTNRAMSFMMPLMMLVMNCLSVLIVWVGGYYVNDGTVQTGDLIAFITYSMIVIMSFLMIGMVAIMLPRANVAAERIHEVISAEPSIRDKEGAASARSSVASSVAGDVDEPALGESSASAGSSAGYVGSPAASASSAAARASASDGVRIEFDHVSFRYDDSSSNVLENVSFVAEPGSTTAIVGATGCGKSTVIKLIERFYDVSSGAVRVDGVDVRDLPLRQLHGTFGYVPQKAFLFSGTVGSNVAYGSSDQDSLRVRRALEIAQAAEFVDQREEGLDAPVSQGGTNVSGGQRQRLAIARALATDARGFLFDDSFSALDYRTDARLRQELSQKLAGKTVVIVAQRIATIMHADRIVVLEDGRVVGQGTHAQLMEGCPEYRDIALSQLSEEELAKGGDR